MYTYSDAIFILCVDKTRRSDLITVICGVSNIVRCGFIILETGGKKRLPL